MSLKPTIVVSDAHKASHPSRTVLRYCVGCHEFLWLAKAGVERVEQKWPDTLYACDSCAKSKLRRRLRRGRPA